MKIFAPIFLEIMKDMDGSYEFLPLTKCSDWDKADELAWKTHAEFMAKPEGKGFTGKDALNSNKDDFLTALREDGCVVTSSADDKRRIVYRIIQFELSVRLDIA